jgi:hypothetical protein
VENASNTFRLIFVEETGRISSDRVTRAPSRNDPPADEDGSPVRIRAPDPNQDHTHVSDEGLLTPDLVLLPVHDEESLKVVVPSLRPPREKRRLRFTLPDDTQVPTREKTRPPEVSEQEYVVDKILDVWEVVDGRSRVYRVRWLVYNPN